MMTYPLGEGPEPWERAHPREVSAEQWERFEGYISEILATLGMDVDVESTQQTPRRFLRALYDCTAGYDGDPKLLTTFETECPGLPDCSLAQVVEGPIGMFSLCEHHVMPFFGHAFVGYIAHDRIIGISKLTRLVRLFAMRFTVQERIGHQIADALVEMTNPHGVAVHLEARHMCTQMRGVRERQPRTRTVIWRGRYADDPSLRREFLQICSVRD